MNKIIVIGCPGSGKSTFSKSLHNVTGIPLFHLDMMFWNGDKTTVEKSVFLERLISIMDQNEWIIDGNYGGTMELRMMACDTIIFLDYPSSVCLEGIYQRRGKMRSDMPWIDSGEDTEFIEFVKNYNAQQRPKVLSLLEKYKEKDVFVLHSREEAGKFILSLTLDDSMEG